jgi:hypothetical protein
VLVKKMALQLDFSSSDLALMIGGQLLVISIALLFVINPIPISATLENFAEKLNKK